MNSKMIHCGIFFVIIFFTTVILYTFFLILCSFMEVLGQGFKCGGLGLGVLGLGFSADGVWGLWCGAFWDFWVWALKMNIEE